MVELATALSKQTREKAGKPMGFNLKVRGDGHPRSRPVITPKGRFGSMALAAEAFGVSRQAAFQWVRDHRPGWRYEGEPETLEAPELLPYGPRRLLAPHRRKSPVPL
jgi:hypothetical protein